MDSWRVPYLPKGCRPDFNNNNGPVRLFEFDSNNGPSPGHSNLVSDEVENLFKSPIYDFLVATMTSVLT